MLKLLSKIFIKDYKNVQDQNVRMAYGKLSSIVGIISNLLLCSIKILTGIFAASVSILADGINNLSDAASSVITLIGFKLASEPADEEHPFGHQRVEYVTGLIVSFIIIAIGLILFKESITTIINNDNNNTFSWLVIIILAISILMKLWQSLFYKKTGKLISSTAIIATSTDSLNDCISTTVVFISLIISKIFPINLDGYMGIVVSIFILISGIKLIKEAISLLIGEAPTKELIKHIEEKVMSYEKILGLHDMVIHSYGPGKMFVTLHAEVSSKEDINVTHDIIDNIERYFMDEENISLCIHMDPIDIFDEETISLREFVKDILKEIDPVLNFHDFRVVKGATHTNLIFDVVVPLKYRLKNEELKELISSKVKERKENYFCVIVIDEELSNAKKGEKNE